MILLTGNCRLSVLRLESITIAIITIKLSKQLSNQNADKVKAVMH